MKRFIVIVIGFLLVAGCGGCQSKQAEQKQPISHLVTEITVIRLSDLEIHRYTGHQSMGRILNYLRNLDPFGKTPGPTHPSKQDYRITLIFSDGRQRTYLQHDQQYFLDWDNRWKLILPEDAQHFSLLFAGMPSEAL